MNAKNLNNFHPLTCTRLTFFTISAVIIQIIGLSFFIMGFFPVKPSLSGMSGLESFYPPGFDSTNLAQNFSTLSPAELKSLYQEVSAVPPLYDRLVLMVIDGLPAEFVLGKDGRPPPKAFMEAMPYTQSLLARRLAIGYHAKAAPPTVTMPRLKAMVSGAVGGFLDVAFNFNTQAFLDDNLIAQFLRIGWKIVMLGDETWLKLFPDMFARHDGVSSFFVKDTVQVDYNVSRHLTDELSRTDWDLLILHFLGLDHVGHIGGRNSVLMCPKLLEMDEVIKRIHSTVEGQEINQRTLLLIVSDHGMTESGNHGGSSYEETDSLALFVGAEKFKNIAESNYNANQVDIAATLALLFGVPIPKNNIGSVMAEIFTSLKDEEQLRILQLNLWQLLRLLEPHLTELGCENVTCVSGNSRNDGPERFCCLYLNVTALHKSWQSQNSLGNAHRPDIRAITLAYTDLLRSASNWLSRRATDKPPGLLASGIAAMLMSCLGLLILLLLFGNEVVPLKGSQLISCANTMQRWHLDEHFILIVIFLIILSMASSSMVEEEHYIWHFMTSTLYLILLRKAIQLCASGSLQSVSTLVKEKKRRNYHSIYCIITVLASGRILRGWHQGGVNWSHLPDISKLLEQAGTVYVKYLQLVSTILIIILCFTFLLALRLNLRLTTVLALIYLPPALLILKFIRSQDSTVISSAVSSTTLIQIIYALLGISTLGILVATPWLIPLRYSKTTGDTEFPNDASYGVQSKCLLRSIRDSINAIGWSCIVSWCLLQHLLQQPINSMPVTLLVLQVFCSIRCFSDDNMHMKQWVKVAALFYLGMAGHFSLGNTNTLATIDVAGAFIGISTHSTVISGILMFMITYASPLLVLLSTLLDVSLNDVSESAPSQDADLGHQLQTIVGYSCLVPLGLNSILLLSYTIVLLLMQNHLFIWSVFSPKYLYVCATAVCVYVGVSLVTVTATYTCIVFSVRRMVASCRNR